MISQIRAIIIDDESLCIDNLRHYLKANCSRIEVAGTGEQPECIDKLLQTVLPDIAFLDVHLFDRNVFDWLAQHHYDIPIVFVTAYEGYAMNAFRASAFDYLLKPLETSEVQRCYHKITSFFDGLRKPTAAGPGNITLRQGNELYVLPLTDIILLKANGFYTNVCFYYNGAIRNILVSKPISIVCREWDEPLLMRVHRSYVVNLKRISSIIRSESGLVLETLCGPVPVAKSRSNEFLTQYHV